MKKIVFIIVIFCVHYWSGAQEIKGLSAETGLHFEQGLSWKQVLAKAKKEKKYIFVDCYATWCGPCKLMDKNTYPNGTVGEFINRSFLAVKFQFDTLKSDAQEIKNQYPDAHLIKTNYHITAYPTFLFFSPKGELVHFGVGYRDPKNFIVLARDAMDPEKQYMTILKAYKKGKLPYEKMLGLANMASVLNDTSTTSSVSKDYVYNYLERLPDSAWENKKNLYSIQTRFVMPYLSSNSRAFSWLMQHGQTADSIMKWEGYAENMISSFIYREELTPAIDVAKKNTSVPDWNNIHNKIAAKFGDVYAKKLVAPGKVELYKSRKDWVPYCNATVETVEANGWMNNPKDNSMNLNNSAFEIFQHSNDRELLQTAVKWMEPVMASVTDSSYGVVDILDTQAELLYRLGRKEEAIVLEKRAVELENKIRQKIPNYQPKYHLALEKMQAGLPTW